MEDIGVIGIDPTPRIAGPPELLVWEETPTQTLEMLVVSDDDRRDTGREEDKENAGRPPKVVCAHIY